MTIALADRAERLLESYRRPWQPERWAELREDLGGTVPSVTERNELAAGDVRGHVLGWRIRRDATRLQRSSSVIEMRQTSGSAALKPERI
jgi:hypothetical protein